MEFRMESSPYDPRYLKGIEYFNECEFFEAHEAWEELWADDASPSRAFFQGLIQAAVALHHFGNGNIRGAKKLYDSSRRYLDPYQPRHLGLDVRRFLEQFAACFADVVSSQEAFPQIEINAALIPEIHLEP
jgi:predicted metal-dependent hydrolase